MQNPIQLHCIICSGAMSAVLIWTHNEYINNIASFKYKATGLVSKRRDGVVVRAPASQSVDLGFIPLVESYQKTLKNGIRSFLLGARHLRKVVENKPASSLVVSLGKALNGTPPPLCGRQVAHKPRKRQLPSECGLPVQSIAIQFAFS